MIKINLALRKQSGAISSDSKASQSGGGGLQLPAGLSKFSLDVDQLKELPIRKLLVPVVAGFAASYLLDMHKEEELQKADAVIAQLQQEKDKLQAEAGKMKGYEEIRKGLEADQQILKTKIDTIEVLVKDRANPPKVLLALANATPKDVWLSEFHTSDKEVVFKGYSLGFNQVSDFMKNLGESAFFVDLNIKNTQQAKDDRGVEVASFELTAKRRK